MYENFDLCRFNKGTIVGYRWDIESPDLTVCLIHGIGEYAGRYNRVTSAFNKAGAAVVSMDLRGHGRSGGKRGHCAPREGVLRDVDVLIEYAKDLHPGVPVVLYGHSLGGNIVLDYRSRGKCNGEIAGYIVSAPWLVLYSQPSGIFNMYVRTVNRFHPGKTISSKVDEADLGNLESVGNYKSDPLVHDKISVQCAVEGFDIGNALSDGTYADSGRAAGIPMLLMQGTADKICDISGCRAFASQQGDECEYVEWEGLCHEIHNGGPDSKGDEVIEKMADFLRKLKK